MRGVALLLIAAVSLQSCKDGAASMMPKSGGRPFEVLIVANDRAAGAVVDSVLSTDTPCLPQPEPLFDTSLTDSARFNRTARLARSIVIVTVSGWLFTETHIRYEKNVWVKDQMVTYVNAPDVATLRRGMNKAGSQLVALLTRFELNSAIRRLAAGSNWWADSMAAAVAGKRMRVPVELTSSKRGKDFLWLSDNANSGMTNICVYAYGGLDAGAERFRTARDSVMRVNIPGERAGMYMTTVQEPLSCAAEMVRLRPRTIVRGLWEMRGDAMGGPFVAHVVADSARRRMVVAEAFVYAPETKKRNLIRKAEAALYTLK